MNVCLVLFVFCLSTCVCVCLQIQGPLRECLRAGRLWASPLLHLHLFSFLLVFSLLLCGDKTKKKKMSRSHYCTTNAKEIKRMHNVQWLCLKVEYSPPKKARQKDHSYSFSTCREGISGVAPLTPPPNQIYSRIWYAFSLFLRKFHSVNPFNGNFCEPGRAQFAEKKMEIPSHDVSNTGRAASGGAFTFACRRWRYRC